MRSPMSPRTVVWVAAVFAVLARFPSALWPLRPDEAGFLLVARAWQPEADSLYGTYWVDRPPTVIALVWLTDWIGGPYAVRVLAALGMGVVVLCLAVAARRLVAWVEGSAAQAGRVAAWTAVLAAAFTSTAWVDPLSAKGEEFGIPLVAGSCWLSLLALQRHSPRHAFTAGLLAMLAVGMKQSIVGGLVFGAALLVAATVTRRLDVRQAGRLAAAALAGALVPVAACVAWALTAGVRLSTLWYATVGFRVAANEVIASQSSEAPDLRARLIVLILFSSGMALVVAWLLVRLPTVLRHLAVPGAAVVAMLAVDAAGIVLGGSYWRTYLVVLVPPLVLAMATVLTAEAVEPVRRAHDITLRLLTRVVLTVCAVLSALSLVDWTVRWWEVDAPPAEFYTGQAIRAATRPGDTLTIYGGRADMQLASGMRSPYENLWSLPMRTNDPDLHELGDLLTGPFAPTWFVEYVQLSAWDADGVDVVEPSLLTRYDLVGVVCDDYRVYRLHSVDRPVLDVDCAKPYRSFLGHRL